MGGIRLATAAVIFAAAITLCLLPAMAQDGSPAWITRLSGKHVAGEGVGHTDGYTSLEWFLPLDPDSRSTMWFADIAGLIFERDSFGANIGLGYRSFVPEQNRVYGLNAYWDMQQDNGLLFNQAALGFESLGEVFDVRINGYTPTVNDASQYLPFSFVGHNLLFREMNALSGVDYETGINLPAWRSIRAFVGAGGYYFDSSKTAAAAGWRVRAELAFEDTVAAQFVVQDDDLFGRTYNVVVEVRSLLRHRTPARVPMDPLFRNPQGTGDGRTVMHRLADPVHRQQNIVLHRREEIAEDTSGTPLTFLHVVSGAAGDGSFEAPYGTLTAAIGDPLAATSVVYTPRGGTFTENVTLVDGVRLLSNGPIQQVASSEGDLVLPFSGRSSDLSALPATINGDVILNHNSEFSGFDVMGGISGAGLTNVNVNHSSISAAPADALSLTGSDGLTITDLLVTSPAGRGVLLSDSDASITRLEVRDAADDGIQIDTGAASRTVTINDLTISNAAAEGIDVNVAGAGDLTLALDSLTATADGDVVDIEVSGAGDALVSFANATLSSATATGFRADGSAGGTLTLNQFESIEVTQANTGGIALTAVTFDADSTVPGIQTVRSTNLNIGTSTSRVTGAGLEATDITGSWDLGTTSIFSQDGVGLRVDNSGLGTPVGLSSDVNSVLDSTARAALDLHTLTSDLNFSTITSTNSTTHGVVLHTVSGRVDSAATTVAESVAESFRYENIALPATLTADFGATTIDSTLGPNDTDNIDKVGDTTGLTEIYTPLTINFP